MYAFLYSYEARTLLEYDSMGLGATYKQDGWSG